MIQPCEKTISKADPVSVGVSFSVSDSKASNKAVFCAHLIPNTVEENGSCSFVISSYQDLLWYHKVIEAINFLLIDDPSLVFTIGGTECPTFLLFRLVRDLRHLVNEADAPTPVDPYTLYLNECHEPLIIINDYKP